MARQLTKKEKLDFLDYCMVEVVNLLGSHFCHVELFTCNKLMQRFRGEGCSESFARSAFPELIKYSRLENEIQFFSEIRNNGKEHNEIRAIIYAFLWNELTGQITV